MGFDCGKWIVKCSGLLLVMYGWSGLGVWFDGSISVCLRASHFSTKLEHDGEEDDGVTRTRIQSIGYITRYRLVRDFGFRWYPSPEN